MTYLRELLGVEVHGPFTVRTYVDTDDGEATVEVRCDLCDTTVAAGRAFTDDPFDVPAAEERHLSRVHHGCYHAADCTGGGPDCHCDPWEPTR